MAPTAIIAMTHAEAKHWSKAMAAVLRHGAGSLTNRELPLETLVVMLHTGHTYGPPTAAKLRQVAMTNHRFILVDVQDAASGWWSVNVRAL
jgi:hypothetical protein